MKTKLLRKSTAMLLVFMAVLLSAAPALAASQKVYATTPLNLRSGPGTNYTIVGSLTKGQVVNRVGTTGNWSILDVGGKRVYASSSYLRVYQDGGSGSSTSIMYATGRVNVRSGPGTEYKVLSTLNGGESVSTLGTVGNWTIIKWRDDTAYVYTKYLKAGSGSGGSGAGDGLILADGRMRTTANVNVRSGPGTNYSITGWLAKGSTVTRTGITGSWTQINFNGTRAYVHSGYLELLGGNIETPDVTPVSGTVEAIVDVNIRSGPGTNYATLGTLYKGQRLARTAIVGNWTRVTYKNSVAYVFTSYLRVVSGSPGTTEKIYITTPTTMRSGPGNTYGSITTLSAGTAVILIETTGGWSRIEYRSYTGYVPASSLSSTPNPPTVPITGVAYAPNGTYMYAGPASSYNRLGTLSPGGYAPCILEVNGWTQINYNNTTGYVRSSDIVVLSSSAQTSFTALEKQMYSKADSLPVYTIPSDSTAYRYGFMTLNEPVKQLAYNSVWTRIYADGRILYTRTENLKGSDAAIVPEPGDVMIVTNPNGAAMYTDSNMTVQYLVQDSQGSTITDRIPVNTKVTFCRIVNYATEVYWASYNVTVYINSNDVKLP